MNYLYISIGATLMIAGVIVFGLGVISQKPPVVNTPLEPTKIVPVGAPSSAMPRSITGQIFNDGGQPVPRAFVSLRASEFANAYQTITNDQGVWLLMTVWPSDAAIFVQIMAADCEPLNIPLPADHHDKIVPFTLKRREAIQ